MKNIARTFPEFDEEATELAALTAALAEARAWLLKVAEGNFDTPLPAAR